MRGRFGAVALAVSRRVANLAVRISGTRFRSAVWLPIPLRRLAGRITFADTIRETERYAAWATILIDKLLHAVRQAGGERSPHHRRPAAGVAAAMAACGGWRPKCSTPDDTVALMKSITPDRCQKELAEVGGTDFGFAFGDAGPVPRVGLQAARQRGHGAAADSQQAADVGAVGHCRRSCKKLCMRPRGLFLVTGPTGSGKSTTLASMINYINETLDHHIITIEDPIEFYHYQQEVDGQPARSRRRRAELFRGLAPRVAARPRRDPGRRNARPGNDRSRHHGGRNRATSCSARCTPPAPKAP